MSFKKLAEVLRNNSWLDRAACREVTDPEIFFEHAGHGEGAEALEDAKMICNGTEYTPPCSVRMACLGYALEANERFGVWGGLNAAERRRMKRDVRYRHKLREEAARQVEEERERGHSIQTPTRTIVRKPHV
ncbi:MAG: WhiB family transcriptional regulator [Dermatophilaceae bacterium]